MKKITYLTYAALFALTSCTNEINEEGFVEKENKIRKNYHNYYSKQKWGDSRHYDLIVNASKIGLDNAVEVINRYIKSTENDI